MGFPIRKSTDQSLLAAPHGLSQRATSFIASQCQGIHQMPLRRLIHSSRSRAGTSPHNANTTNSTIRFSSCHDPLPDHDRKLALSAKRQPSLQSGTHSVTLHKTIFTMFKNRQPLLPTVTLSGNRSVASHGYLTAQLTQAQHSLQNGAPSPCRARNFCSKRAAGTFRAPSRRTAKVGGGGRDRTDDLMLAKHALSQLSYAPNSLGKV